MLPWPSSWILELNDSANLNLHFTLMPPIKFRLNLTFEEFQDGHCGGHLGYQNGTILASHQVSAQSDLGFRNMFEELRWPPWWPSWILERNDFSSFESLCHCDASHQVSAQSDLGFRSRCRLKNFKLATLAAILDTLRNDFSDFESLCHLPSSLSSTGLRV